MNDFIDDNDLLQFSQPEDVPTQTGRSGSILVSDWTNQELADLYRAHSLVQSAQPGLECDRGISDEGDPWFLIGDDKGDVLVHICRIKGIYILDSAALAKPLRGANFNTLIHGFLATVAEDQAQSTHSANEPTNVVCLARGGTVCLHPSMMIAALVWTLLMNSDELTLPHSNGTSHKIQGQNLEQGGNQNAHQNNAGRGDGISSNDEGSDMSEPASFGADTAAPIKSGECETDGSDIYGDLSAGALPGGIAERDEKQLNASAYSNALTTLATAIGFYASANASNVFWNSAAQVTDPSVTFGELETNDTDGFRTPTDHLSDALALLSSVVDLIHFESVEGYATENQNTSDESSETLSSSTTEAAVINTGEQMLVMASEILKTLAGSSQINLSDPSGAVVDGTAGLEMANAVQRDVAAEWYQASARPTLTQELPDTSIDDITMAYEAADVDISRYDASSLKVGLETFDDELEKYADALEGTIVSEEQADPTSSETEAASSGVSDINAFDDFARSFIDTKVATSDVEVLVFASEIVFVDKGAFSGNNMSVSWQLEDGGRISMIGLSSEMEEFLVA